MKVNEMKTTQDFIRKKKFTLGNCQGQLFGRQLFQSGGGLFTVESRIFNGLIITHIKW